MKFKQVLKKYKVLIFFSIVVTVFLISLFSTAVYYRELEKKANFLMYQNVIYNEDENLDFNSKFNSLDIFVPKDIPEDKQLPVMIFIHGGADKENFLLKAIYFTNNDFILVNVNYRVFPNVRFPVYIQDVSKSIKWVYDNIEKYNGDKNKIFLKGHSAGAQIASLISTDERYLKENDLDFNVIKGVVLLEGVGYNISKSKEFDFDSQIVNRYLMFPFGEDEKILREASSINYISEDKNLPPMIIFGAENSILRIAKIEALDFYLKLIEENKYARYFISKNKNHSSLNRYFGEEDDFTTIKTMEFIKDVLDNKIRR